MARDRERPRTADGYYSIDDRTPLLPPPYPSSTCPSRPTTAAAPTTQATPKLYPYRERRSICARCLLIVFSLVVIFTIVIIGFWLGYNWKDPNSECSDYITQYSPILEDMALDYKTVQFNGSLLQRNEFRQDAGPEVDAAWATLGIGYRTLVVEESLAIRSGLEADQVKINDKYGGGYPAQVEGLRHLACLNLLRQGLWYNFEYYTNQGEGIFANEPRMVKLHITQCLDIIRQQLMCVVDIGMQGQVWIQPDHTPEPYVDSSTDHRCRDFDTIRAWAKDKQVAENPPSDFLEPPKDGDLVDEIR